MRLMTPISAGGEARLSRGRGSGPLAFKMSRQGATNAMSPDAQRSRTSNASGHLDVVTAGNGDPATVTLTGELDMSAAPGVLASLEGLTGQSRAIVLDIDAVAFIDSAGLRCILMCEGLCRDAGVELRLTPGSPRVRRVFKVAGLLDRLPAPGPDLAAED